MSASRPITPRSNLLETAEYDEYARWCERGRPRGIPLLDCPGAIERFVTDVVPELQRRGRMRVEYAGKTLRDILRQED